MIFEDFCSLGTLCPTASSMSKYGLRSYSGVFDWLITYDFKYVLHYMENDFCGFMLKDNLARYENSPKMFYDISSKFIFMHDKEFPFETAYDKLQEKYQKKIIRFLERTQKATCFIRIVVSENEIEYIDRHSEYIQSVIKKNCNENEIVFLVKNEIGRLPLKFRSFIFNPYKTGGNREALRSYFDGAEEFLDFCASHYDSRKLLRNVAFDAKKEEDIYRAASLRFQTLCDLIRLKGELRIGKGPVVIYGAGDLGIFLYEKLKGNCEVTAFVDVFKAGTYVDDIPVLKIDDADLRDKQVIITTAHDVQKVQRIIGNIEPSAQALSLEDILQNRGI